MVPEMSPFVSGIEVRVKPQAVPEAIRGQGEVVRENCRGTDKMSERGCKVELKMLY